MAFDDEPDDAFGFQPPLPPEDRLWRHPSELGPAGADRPITIVNRPQAPVRLWLVAALSAVLGAGGTLGILALTGTFDDEVRTPPVEVVSIPVPKQPRAEALAVADGVRPAVARVQGDGPAGPTSGTGVFFRTDGYLLTSADAVNGATSIEVVLHDGQIEAGQLVGTDTENDIAVVKVERSDLASATIGQPSGLQMGENTIVISFTERPDAPIIGEGLVSGLRQKVKHEAATMHGLIQTSVRLHTDATGAPLIDSSGAVVGIVTRRGTSPDATRPAGVQRGSGSSGAEVWFATPIDWAKRLADQIVTHGRVVDEVAMGVTGGDLPVEKQEDLGRGAAAVQEVVPGSAAEAGGLAPGDLITAIDGMPVTDWSDLVLAVRLRRPGETVSVTYLRGAEENVSLLTLQGKPADS